YERLRRGTENVFYLTGTDEHGEKIERAAAATQLTPQAFLEKVVENYRKTWEELGIRYDDFIRTTEPRHQRIVQENWRKLIQNGDIYPGHYEGLYCVACESFYLEKDLL